MWATLEAHFSRVPEEKRLAALDALRERFLRQDVVADYLDDAATAAAYESWFFPQSYAKAASVLSEISAGPVRRIVDLGAGMGPFGFAALARFPGAELVLVDRARAALHSGQALAAALSVRVRTIGESLETAEWPPADLLLIGNALLELEPQARRAVLEKMFSRLLPGGHLIIIEPGDRPHARALQALRDALLPRAPLAPCPHAAACPASVRERDFCHQARRLDLPPFWHALAERVGLSDTRMRFSYLIYGGEPAGERDALRIISNRLVEKGRIRYFACGKSGAVEIMRQDRLRSAKNAAFDQLGRGALVRLATQGPRVKLGADDEVEVIGESDPWDAET